MRLRYRSRAIDDLVEIRRYIAEDNPHAARRLVTRIRERCRSLVRTPYFGRARPELRPDLRSFPVGSYVIFYRVIGETIEIVSIVHGARDIDALF